MLSSFARLSDFLIRDLELWFPIRAVLCQITRFVCFCFLAGMRSRFCVRWFVLVQPGADQVLTEVLELVWQCENQHEHRLTIEMSNKARFKLRLEFDFCARKRATVLTAAS